MPGGCRVSPQGSTVPLLNIAPHHHHHPHKNYRPTQSVFCKPLQVPRLNPSFCCNTHKDFHIKKPQALGAASQSPDFPIKRPHPPGANSQNHDFHIKRTHPLVANQSPDFHIKKQQALTTNFQKPKPNASCAITKKYYDKLRKRTSLSLGKFRKSFLLSWSQSFLRMKKSYGSHLLILLALGYWLQGFRGFPWLGMNFYLKDRLRVNPGTLQFLQHTVNLPMVAKPVYGIFSDAVYIGGAHRLPYIAIGGLLQVASWGMIAIAPAAGSSVATVMALLLLSNLGASIVEVATDALVAECGKKQKGDSSGELQSFAWMALAAGSLLGNLFGGIFVSQVDARTMFTVFALLLTIQVATSLIFREDSLGLTSVKRTNIAEGSKQIKRKLRSFSSSKNLIANASTNIVLGFGRRHSALVTSIKSQIADVVEILKKPEIAYPLAWFAASYAIIPLLTGTMFFYHTQHLKIDPSILGLAKVVGQIGLLLGSIIYNRFLKKTPFRKLLFSVQLLLSACMLSDIFLVKQLNIRIGIPNEVFILGASATAEAVAQFKILPFTVLFAQLCPDGCEGSLMALVMSAQCLASIVSGYLGVILASLLKVSPEDYSRLPLGIFIQSMATLVPLIWLSFIPNAEPSSEHPKAKSKVV